MVTSHNEHQLISFKYDKHTTSSEYLCTECGVLVYENGFLAGRAVEILYNNGNIVIYDGGCTARAASKNKHISDCSCSDYKERSKSHIDKVKHLGHKWKPDRPSVLLQCEVCDVEFWLNDGEWVEIIPSEIRYKAFKTNLRSCDEIIMNKVLK